MELLKWSAWLAGCVLSAVLYRMGGSEDYDTVWRDWVLPLTSLGLVYLYTNTLHWSYILSYGLLGGSLTTYNKWASRLAGYGDDEVHNPSWYVTGLFYGLAFLPLVLMGIDWKLIVLRAGLLSLLVAMWSQTQSDAVTEECGRGLCINCTIPLLFLGG